MKKPKIRKITIGFARWFLMRIGHLDKEVQEKFKGRLRTCLKCDDNIHGKCRHCGCFVQAKALSGDDCPIGKF